MSSAARTTPSLALEIRRTFRSSAAASFSRSWARPQNSLLSAGEVEVTRCLPGRGA